MDQVKTGRFLAELRHEGGITQESLGQRLGVTNKTISRWENGNYMPDIEMLVLLSDQFDVSIHELLAGERLSEEHFRQTADRQLLDVWNTSAFSIRERSAFWKRKWLLEHLVSIAIGILVPFFMLIWAVYTSLYWLAIVCPIAFLVSYAFLRNRMMCYVESKVFLMPTLPDEGKR